MDNCVESLWRDYRRIDFSFAGQEALLIFPHNAAAGKPWAQYTEYFGAFPDTALALLARGYHLAFIKNTHRWGDEGDYQRKKEFSYFLTKRFGLSSRSILIGMSCGGMIAVHCAVRFPELVEALYLDAPVISLRSCPLALGRAERDEELEKECLAALKMTRSQLLSFQGNPLDELPDLVATKIPVAMVYGAVDKTVPYEENGRLLEQAYRTANCPIQVWGKPNCDHHPHGLEDPTPVVEWLTEISQ